MHVNSDLIKLVHPHKLAITLSPSLKLQIAHQWNYQSTQLDKHNFATNSDRKRLNVVTRGITSDPPGKAETTCSINVLELGQSIGVVYICIQ